MPRGVETLYCFGIAPLPLHRGQVISHRPMHRKHRRVSLSPALPALPSGLRPIVAHTQRGGRPVRRSDRYEDSIISERKPFAWPGDKTLAVWIAPNVEVWDYDSPAGQAVSPNVGKIVPDVGNYAWREYGMR